MWGRSGLLVSGIGLATMNFGYLADETSSFAVMDAAFDAGLPMTRSECRWHVDCANSSGK